MLSLFLLSLPLVSGIIVAILFSNPLNSLAGLALICLSCIYLRRVNYLNLNILSLTNRLRISIGVQVPCLLKMHL
jgi:O-antigen ligase